VAQGEKVLHKIGADLKLLDTRSTEAQEIREEVDDTDTFIRVAVDRGYDGLIDTTNGFVQVYRDIKPAEISESRPMFPGERAMTLGSTRIPGGFEGTFTYEELIWLKEQGIDVSGLSEDVHLKLHEKIVRTMQPEKKDTLQTLNNFIFSMMSPNQPLTPNELGYAVVRVRNNEESQQWAARVPWDAPSGQEPHPDVLEADENKEEAEAHILEGFEQGFDLPDVGTGKEAYFANPGAFRKYYREYYDRKIAREFNLQAREVGGMGLLGTAQMSFVSELNQYYQIDPEWFLMQDADVDENGQPSWHTYVERLSTQFSGIATKVGSFAAVWQDPMNAAISAIDRHMGRLFLPELFETNAKRQKWERGMVKDWNKSEPEKIQNFDELFLRAGGDGFFVKGLMTLFGTKTAALYTTRGRKRETIIREIKERNPNLPAHWREWAGTFLSLPENRRIQLMSDKYRAALDYNAKESKRLGLGLFSSQWFLWDRYRRRLEPHEINFPGLYKLPHLSKERVTKVRDAHGEAGYLNMTPKW